MPPAICPGMSGIWSPYRDWTEPAVRHSKERQPARNKQHNRSAEHQQMTRRPAANDRSVLMCSASRATRMLPAEPAACAARATARSPHPSQASPTRATASLPLLARRCVHSPPLVDHDERDGASCEDDSCNRIRIDERSVEHDRHGQRNARPGNPGGTRVVRQEMPTLPDESGPHRGQRRDPYDDRPIAAQREGRCDQRGSPGAWFEVVRRSRRPAPVAGQEVRRSSRVVATLVVVRNLQVVIQKKALGHHQIMRLVASRWTDCPVHTARKTPNARTAATIGASADRRRLQIGSPVVQTRGWPAIPSRSHPIRRKPMGRSTQGTHRGHGAHPGKGNHQREEQRQAGLRGQAHRRHDGDRGYDQNHQKPQRREQADSPHAVSVGDSQDAKRKPQRRSHAHGRGERGLGHEHAARRPSRLEQLIRRRDARRGAFMRS